MRDPVVLCPDCAKKELAGEGFSDNSIDYTEYYCSYGLEFLGCDHLSIVEKECVKIGC